MVGSDQFPFGLVSAKILPETVSFREGAHFWWLQVGLGCNKIPLQQMDFHSLHASYGLGWNPGHSDSAARWM